MKPKASVLAVLILAAVVGASAAVSMTTTTGPVNDQPMNDLRMQDGKLLLTLDEAREIALSRNLSIVIEKLRKREAELSLWSNEGIYDPNLTVDLSAFEETTPSASNLDGADVRVSENLAWNLGLSRLFPSGGTGQLLFNNNRFKSNSTFATLNPNFSVDFDINYRQPLLRNFGKAATNRGIRVARTNLDISRENFELQVIAILQAVEDAYWNLVEAQAQLTVSEESLTLAEQLHEQNRIRVEVGTLAPLELIQSEAGVATRQEEIIRSRAAVGDSEDVLRQLMNFTDADLWSTELVLETAPERDRVAIDLEDAMRTALDQRPELRSKRLSQQNLHQDIDFFKNQELPRLDLNLTYGANGVGGDLTERNFFTGEIIRELPGGYSDALDQIPGAEFDGWSVAVNLAYPFGNRTGKAQRALAEVGYDRGVAELGDLELAVRTEVRRLTRFVRTTWQALESARVSRRLEEKNLEAEQKRYQNGMSTSFQVLQIQEDLTAARSREVSAITGYRKALVQYYRAIGRLTEESGVELAGPLDGSES